MSFTVVGIDPGFAAGAAAVVRWDPAMGRGLLSQHVLMRTTKRAKVDRVRVTTDDVRRFEEIARALGTLNLMSGSIVAVESYAPRPGKGGQSGWKTAAAHGLVCGVAFGAGAKVLAFRPGDLKREVAGRADASKEDVADVVLGLVDGLRAALTLYPKGQHEHLTDAAALAVLGAREVMRLRATMGYEG